MMIRWCERCLTARPMIETLECPTCKQPTNSVDAVTLANRLGDQIRDNPVG